MEPAAPAVNAEALRTALVETLRARGRLQSPAIAAAFAQVPRHLFVPDVSLDEASRDTFIERNVGDEQMAGNLRSEEHTSELQSHVNLVCRLLLEKKKKALHLHSRRV